MNAFAPADGEALLGFHANAADLRRTRGVKGQGIGNGALGEVDLQRQSRKKDLLGRLTGAHTPAQPQGQDRGHEQGEPPTQQAGKWSKAISLGGQTGQHGEQ